MTRPTLTAVHEELCSDLATPLGVTAVVKLHPSWGRPEGATPMAGLGWQGANQEIVTIGSHMRPITWRLSYYGANERQLLAAAEALIAWADTTGSGWTVGGYPVEVSIADMTRQTPESGLSVEANAFDATLVTMY